MGTAGRERPRLEDRVVSDASTVHEPPRRAGAAATRERILDAAADRFYADGIRGTSADRLIQLVGITKVTFYRHFPTKTDLVVAYLERQAALERGAMVRATEGRGVDEALSGVAATIGAASCWPGFRGCAFINAAAEFPDPDDPVRVVVDRHRRWTSDLFRGIAVDAGVADADATAAQLMMLRDGAMVGGSLDHPDRIAETLRSAFRVVVGLR
jgi:AcrR family transcriptional regulator